MSNRAVPLHASGGRAAILRMKNIRRIIENLYEMQQAQKLLETRLNGDPPCKGFPGAGYLALLRNPLLNLDHSLLIFE